MQISCMDIPTVMMLENRATRRIARAIWAWWTVLRSIFSGRSSSCGCSTVLNMRRRSCFGVLLAGGSKSSSPISPWGSQVRRIWRIYQMAIATLPVERTRKPMVNM